MRISTNTMYALGIATIQQQQSELVKLQQQVSTGRRILTPADDPVAAARALEVSQSVAVTQQFNSNASNANDALSLEESVLGSITGSIQDIRSLVVTAGNAGLNDADRKSLATELQGKYQELLGYANGTDGSGQFLFSGYKGTTTPFTETAPGTVAYNGDDGQRLAQISASRLLPTNDAGSDIFMRIKNSSATFTTAAAVTNTGGGAISNGVVTDATKWNTAVNSKDFTVRFDVTLGVTTYDIVDNLNNVSLLTGAAPAAGPYLRAYAGSTTVSLKTQAPPDTSLTPFDYGAEFTMSGAPVNGDSFTVKASATQDLFTTVSSVITALQTPLTPGSGNTALVKRLNDTLSNLDNSLSNVLRVRSSVGARLNELDSVQASGADLLLQHQQVLSKLQDVDLAKAISDLTQGQTTLQAAQKSFLAVSGLSLFNYM
jgi:flagellar hook-associated protein 3 FlgL